MKTSFTAHFIFYGCILHFELLLSSQNSTLILNERRQMHTYKSSRYKIENSQKAIHFMTIIELEKFRILYFFYSDCLVSKTTWNLEGANETAGTLSTSGISPLGKETMNRWKMVVANRKS
jgi:hypothetical protein